MFEFITNTEERGQVGIGTLIVFIAMVLVAAIAAGVLINTAGFLQTQAEATGQDSTDLVSERIDVTSEVGIVETGQDPSALDEIRLTVSGAAGADDINLADTTLQAVGPGGQSNLVFTDQPTSDVAALSIPQVDEESDLTNNGPVTVSVSTNYDAFDSFDSTTAQRVEFSLTDDSEGSTVTTEQTGDDSGNTDFNIVDQSTADSASTDLAAPTSEIVNPDEITVTIYDTSGAEDEEIGTVTQTVGAQDGPAELTGTVDDAATVQNLDGDEFAIDDPDGDFESSPVLNSENQYTILINPSAGAFNEGTFGEGNTATLDIVSPAGATTTVELRAPDLFSEGGAAVQL
ncbi:flagellin [Halorubrum aquaticum]|uniref:Flagellin n=1 Tax=Halorubrum aquaticum TaxID=387340 RepID=A0A1I2ZST6_9EURY|nr:archaellin/type IV pilin N-terminal domain-containing protein [Halorubrum aquaticum]SFH40760.1 flagellin [Halorubrum aquaticum]